MVSKEVIAKLKKVELLTYQLGKPEINPVFFEKRVYQGSSGKVYPVPFIDKVYDTPEPKNYQVATLENEFVRLKMLPEIGGRIFEAQDKCNENYDFFYKQEVIKPALVGLAGPWISGGVEFNWPQHHRPGTYLPSDLYIEHEADGAKTIWMSEYDPMYRLKGMHGIRLRPDSSLIELRGRLFNRTPHTQTFLWWSNVAVEVHDQYQSFFPPDVHYVADHAVRAMSSFPQADNDYYGIPYHQRPGKNDLRKYENITVPTSYMVCDTKYDFFGGYDFKADGGFVHIANRHIAPGKKQWTWGSDEFGKAWDRELTDVGGPYFELMAGVYTDNQPDFTYLLPFETKTFSQFWWSYKKLGPVQNANTEVAVKFVPSQGNKLEIGLASSCNLHDLMVKLYVGTNTEEIADICVSPEQPWLADRNFESGDEKNLGIEIFDHTGRKLVAYYHADIEKVRNRDQAFEPAHPEEVNSASEMDLIGEHLEQYRHPTRYPIPYWEAAIEKDAFNYKSLISLGKEMIKTGLFSKAKQYLQEAIRILTTYHPNPSTGEAHYYYGLSCFHLGETEEAYKYAYKATWNFEWRAAGYLLVAKIDAKNLDFGTCLKHLDLSLVTNADNNTAHTLKSMVLKKLGKIEEAKEVLQTIKKYDPLDQWAAYEEASNMQDFDPFLTSSRNDAQTIMDIAFEYIESGFYDFAIEVLNLHLSSMQPDCVVPNPMGKRSAMIHILLMWLYEKTGQTKKAAKAKETIKSYSYDYFFPSRLCEVILLEDLYTQNQDLSILGYGLGNFYFNVKRYQDAIDSWCQAENYGCQYATLYRNLGIAYWNAKQDGEEARVYYKKAVELSPNDMRIQFEFDQLKKKLNDLPSDRLNNVLDLGEKVLSRDDFSVELAALYNFNNEYNKALKILNERNFHPWEGGEGQVLKQYTYAHLKKGLEALLERKYSDALHCFEKSFDVPNHLGEKYHPLQAKAHINYYLGKAHQKMGNVDEAEKHFLASTSESGDFIAMAVSEFSEMTYYKALSLRELGKRGEAEKLLIQIADHARSELEKEAKIDYFATSLPLMLVFEDDIQKAHEVANQHLLALANYGLGNPDRAEKLCREILSLDSMHIGAKDLLELVHQKEIA